MANYGACSYGTGYYGIGCGAVVEFRIKPFKFINDKVTNFQAIADRERVALYWEPINRTFSLNALTVNGNAIGLTTIVGSVGDSSFPYDTYTSAGSGMSSVDDIYNNNSIIFSNGINFITTPKTILDYVGSTNTLTTEKLEFPIQTGDRFGFDTIQDLIDDANAYAGATITYTASGNAVTHNVTVYGSSTKTLSVSGGLILNPGQNFTMTNAYHPRLYISDDNGATYDNGTNLTYSVTNSPIGELKEGNYYYNKFIDLSSTFNTIDSKFYIGTYVTFITGLNKGLSKKILSFNITTKEFITEYFPNTVAQSDIFSINTYSLPLYSDIQNYVYKIVLWNNDVNNPIFGPEVVVEPAVSTHTYLSSLNNGYWDTNINTNLYSIVQGVAKEGHSRAETEVKEQATDFSIATVRDIKLYNNFGQNFGFEKNPETSYIRYRKGLQDLIAGFRSTGTNEGLQNIVRSFFRVTPHTEQLSQTGWRYGRNRLGYSQNATGPYTITSVASGAGANSTFTTLTSPGSADYTGDYITFTSSPSGSPFGQALYGEMLSVLTYSASGGVFSWTIDPIDFTIPVGATFTVFDTNTSSNFNTIPHSSLSNLFGTKILAFGPYLSDRDKLSFETLLERSMPLHVDYTVSYQTKIFGESSWGVWNGTATNLGVSYETNTLIPIEENLYEAGSLIDTITSTITSVVSGGYIFTSSNLTSKHNYYKNKYVTFTSGANAGFSKKVLDYLGGKKQLTTEEFPYAITVGDSFKLENIEYQTKYVTQVFDVTPTELFTEPLNAKFDHKFNGSWFARKFSPDIQEKVYIEFSDDGSNFTTSRSLTQNEKLNNTVTATVVASGSPNTTTLTATASGLNHLSNINDYYVGSWLKFTTGPNAVFEGEQIVSYDADNKIIVTNAFSFPISSGDNFIISTTDIKSFARITIYHNRLASKDDVEIESLVIKVT